MNIDQDERELRATLRRQADMVDVPGDFAPAALVRRRRDQRAKAAIAAVAAAAVVVGTVVGKVVGKEMLGDGIAVVDVGRAGAGEGPGPCADQRVGTATATTAAAATAPMAAFARWSRRRRTTAAGAKSPGTSTMSACLRSVARSSRSSWSMFMA